jgi:hypothetical protein
MTKFKILILSPHLDVPFKKEKGIKRNGTIPPIRQHWENFIYNLIDAWRNYGAEIDIWTDYMWAFNKDVRDLSQYHRVYIPHRMDFQFDYYEENARYWMQTVFPHLFTVDRKGWGASHSRYPFDILKEYNFQDNYQPFYDLQKRAKTGASKFDQPLKEIDMEDFVFFPCQLPHDETIKYHSNIGVADALDLVCGWANKRNHKVVVKGHPVNPSSMTPMRQVANRWTHVTWVDDVSISSCLEKCDAVFTLNSGVGMEAMLFEKKVFTFARSEYDTVTRYVERSLLKFSDSSYAKPLNFSLTEDELLNYKKFITNFVRNYCVDSSNLGDFNINKI